MERRLLLDQMLREVIGSGVSIYFQPPESVKMRYPCVLYKWASADTQFADDHPYIKKRRYEIVAITRDPDDELPKKILDFPGCIMDRNYTSDNLYHYVYYVYF